MKCEMQSFDSSLYPDDGVKDTAIRENKFGRQQIDNLLQMLKASARTSRERSLAVTKLQEAIMWLGMDMKDLNEGQSIYPQSYNPQSTVVEPTADGLKM